MRYSSVPAVLVITIAAFASCSQGGPAGKSLDVELRADPTCFEEVATALADDALEGRGIETDGLTRAADLIEAEFARLGLEPASGSFRQSFDAMIGVSLGSDNSLSVNEMPLEVEEEFIPLGFSSSGSFAGPVVFAGFGIRADELGYNDYASLDVQGKVVLAMRFEPGEEDEESPFLGRKPSRWSDLRYKALLAREAGAAALILFDPPREGDDAGRTRLPALKSQGPVSRAGLPVLQVTTDVADSLLTAAGESLAVLSEKIDASYQPQSRALENLVVSGQVDVTPKTSLLDNLVGVRPGSGPLADEYVVVGAHYDHLGFGGQGSMRPGETAIHNGADDNASGVAAMLCGVGELFRDPSLSVSDRRTLVTIAFAAEEIGLGGSSHYAQNPLYPLDRTTAMVNLDMVGRVRQDKLTVMGADSSPEWEQILEQANDGLGFDLTVGGDGYGPSDQMSFYEQKIPVVHLFSGAHEQYHTPEDDAELLNNDGGGRVASLLARMLSRLSTEPIRLAYVESTGGPMMSGDSRGYGAYLGTIPNYSEMSTSASDGVLLSAVRAGGPADRGGIRAEDRIVEIAGTRIENLYDMTFALREHRPGQTVAVVVDRDGELLTFKATLGDRKTMSAESPSGHGETSAHGQAPPRDAAPDDGDS